MSRGVSIIFEDNHLLVLDKPAGLATMGVVAERDSLVNRAKHDLRVRYHKPGNVYLGLVSRLDTGVSGVIVFAKTSKCAARLNEQFKSRDVEKTYWAIVSGSPPPQGECVDRLWHDDRAERVIVVNDERPGSQIARLSFRRLKTVGRGSLLEIELHTGRKHQIRVQLSARGWPIWGDSKYDGREPFAPGLALHARRLAFDHPTTQARLEFFAPPPPSWHRVGITGA